MQWSWLDGWIVAGSIVAFFAAVTTWLLGNFSVFSHDILHISEQPKSLRRPRDVHVTAIMFPLPFLVQAYFVPGDWKGMVNVKTSTPR